LFGLLFIFSSVPGDGRGLGRGGHWIPLSWCSVSSHLPPVSPGGVPTALFVLYSVFCWSHATCTYRFTCVRHMGDTFCLYRFCLCCMHRSFSFPVLRFRSAGVFSRSVRDFLVHFHSFWRFGHTLLFCVLVLFASLGHRWGFCYGLFPIHRYRSVMHVPGRLRSVLPALRCVHVFWTFPAVSVLEFPGHSFCFHAFLRYLRSCANAHHLLFRILLLGVCPGLYRVPWLPACSCLTFHSTGMFLPPLLFSVPIFVLWNIRRFAYRFTPAFPAGAILLHLSTVYRFSGCIPHRFLSTWSWAFVYISLFLYVRLFWSFSRFRSARSWAWA